MNKNELELLREKYLKLVDIHGQLQIQNSLLEDRILTLVETYSNEKNQLEKDLSDAKQQVNYLQDTVNQLQIDKQRYKDDCNLAVRLLHRYPNDFIPMTSGQVQEQIKNRYESTSTNQSIPTQRSFLIPTFPPTFVAPPLLTTTNSSSNVNTQTISHPTTMTDNLRLASEALFKSNSVHRYPSNQYLCSNCNRTVRCCDVSVQTSLSGHDDNNNTGSRLRLVSLTSSDDGLNNDGAWIALDSPHPRLTTQEFHDKKYDDYSSCSIPGMHHV